MAKTSKSEKAVKPNVFMRIGLFIKQIIDELRKVVLLLMALVTGMDFGLGKATLWVFG